MELTRLLGPWAPNLTSLALGSHMLSDLEPFVHQNVSRGLERLRSLRHLYLLGNMYGQFYPVNNVLKIRLPPNIVRQLDTIFIGEGESILDIWVLIRNLIHAKPSGLSCRLWLKHGVPLILHSFSRDTDSRLASSITHLVIGVRSAEEIGQICRMFSCLRYWRLEPNIVVRHAVKGLNFFSRKSYF